MIVKDSEIVNKAKLNVRFERNTFYIIPTNHNLTQRLTLMLPTLAVFQLLRITEL